MVALPLWKLVRRHDIATLATATAATAAAAAAKAAARGSTAPALGTLGAQRRAAAARTPRPVPFPGGRAAQPPAVVVVVVTGGARRHGDLRVLLPAVGTHAGAAVHAVARAAARLGQAGGRHGLGDLVLVDALLARVPRAAVHRVHGHLLANVEVRRQPLPRKVATAAGARHHVARAAADVLVLWVVAGLGPGERGGEWREGPTVLAEHHRRRLAHRALVPPGSAPLRGRRLGILGGPPAVIGLTGRLPLLLFGGLPDVDGRLGRVLTEPLLGRVERPARLGALLGADGLVLVDAVEGKIAPAHIALAKLVTAPVGGLRRLRRRHVALALRVALDEALPFEQREAQRLEVARQLGVEAIDQRGIVPPLPLGLGRTHARRRPRAQELDQRGLRRTEAVHGEVEQPQVRLLLRQHDELGEVGVPAAAFGADELGERLLMLGVVDLRDHAEVLLVAAADGSDQLLVVRPDADAGFGQPLRVHRSDATPQAAVLLQQCVEHRTECLGVVAEPLHLLLGECLEPVRRVAERPHPHEGGAPEVAREFVLEGGGKRRAVLGLEGLYALCHVAAVDAGKQPDEDIVISAHSLHSVVEAARDKGRLGQ
mmetsp:Transcript_35351/g.84491  ORF Transcript_35351/g.84491 Transcript_35351/m.84491 type:complete len:599 (+) Transcript_35351:391-2187(+)